MPTSVSTGLRLLEDYLDEAFAVEDVAVGSSQEVCVRLAASAKVRLVCRDGFAALCEPVGAAAIWLCTLPKNKLHDHDRDPREL